jgi:hypothetical protein
MKKGFILSMVLIASCITVLSFTSAKTSYAAFDTFVSWDKKSSPMKPTSIACRQWCSHENTWADMWALAAWDAQMQVESPQVPRGETSWEVGCGVGSAPNCVMGSCIMICYGSFP